MNEWVHRRGTLTDGGWQTVVDDRVPGWRHTGLRVAEFGDGEARRLEAADVERLVVPLTGPVEVTYAEPGDDGVTVVLAGRASVFDGPADVLYLGAGTSAELRGTGRVAVAEAPTGERLPAVLTRAGDVAVELRGHGRNSRQVHNFGTPDQLRASRFMVVEVITPAGNWSSFPPHKHDTAVPGTELPLEEIYYLETAVSRGLSAPPEADPIGYMRTYTSDAGEIDTLAEVRTGDVVLVPHGYHGPCIAVPGYDLYFLNVMAGPEPERAWRLRDDPAHAWIAATLAHEPIDPRLPYERP